MIEKMLISLFALAIIVVAICERSLLIKEDTENFLEKWESYNDPLWKE